MEENAISVILKDDGMMGQHRHHQAVIRATGGHPIDCPQGLKCVGSQTRHTLICRVSTGSLGLWFTATACKYIYDFTAIIQVNEGAISTQ